MGAHEPQRGSRGIGTRARALRNLLRLEIQQELTGVRLPGSVLVPCHRAISVREDPDAGQRKIGLELPAERGPDALHAARGNARLEEAPRGAKEQQLLEGEFGAAVRTRQRLEPTQAGPAHDPGFRGLKDPGRVSRGEMLRPVHAHPNPRYLDARFFSLADSSSISRSARSSSPDLILASEPLSISPKSRTSSA